MVTGLNLGKMGRSMRECFDWVVLGERVEKYSQMEFRWKDIGKKTNL